MACKSYQFQAEQAACEWFDSDMSDELAEWPGEQRHSACWAGQTRNKLACSALSAPGFEAVGQKSCEAEARVRMKDESSQARSSW